jgi:hypothetical protein
MSNKTFKCFISKLDGEMSYTYYVNMRQIMTPYQRIFVDCIIEARGL